ncbi:alpha/beta fold hydrolase [Rhodopirellula halodulae]|uniref:alpha/beta fold hydrolase n=1 Tax=Rhodopirellula halodulae TaxID=2894198 RepID=UPI001E5D5B22|nr:hypothetical protein [Rhodopirellula sp. JC737]
MSRFSRNILRWTLVLLTHGSVATARVNADDTLRQEESPTIAQAELPTIVKLEEQLPRSPTVVDFHGYQQRDFRWKGVNCKLVCPIRPAKGTPWVWRARFWGHEPQFDVAMLQQGWHVVYCDVADLFGCDDAVERWNQFYGLSQRIGLNPKPLLEGMSRGGVIVMRWASVNPACVSGLYVDNAVMDIRSWPGGKGIGEGSAGAWGKCLEAYEMTESESVSIADGPLDRLQALAKADVPIYALINLEDVVVPPGENSEKLVQRYQDLGGPFTVHRRRGLGHHPHSLEDPAPLVNFATRAFRAAQNRSQPAHAD